eukprot:gene53248-biopygen63994
MAPCTGIVSTRSLCVACTFFACRDGYSRKMMYLICTNRRDSLVHLWLQSQAHEVFDADPELLRADEGCENAELREYQESRFCHYVEGESKHNQPIESYWRQVREKVVDPILIRTQLLEMEGLLFSMSPVDRVCLQLALLDNINVMCFLLLWSNNVTRIRNRGVPDQFSIGDYRSREAQEEVFLSKFRDQHHWGHDPLTNDGAFERDARAVLACPDRGASDWVDWYLALRNASYEILNAVDG